MRIALILSFAATAAGCAPTPEGPARTCSPADWTALVGTPAAAVSMPAGLDHRIYRRGAMVTADYNENRLNIVTDADGTIVEVSCG